jgi:hypothetical protein
MSQPATAVRKAKGVEAEWLKLDFGDARVALPLRPPPSTDVKEAIIRWLDEKL